MKDKVSLTEYYPQIDSVRAIAVLFVLFHHYFAERITTLVPMGAFGVDIFFTLSGFLITGILISYKSIKPAGVAIRKFYFRRILRIFPIYYLYILVVILIFGKEVSRTVILWASVYGLNFYIINHGLLSKYMFAHFWSLAVEEQFYLVWPFLILLFPFKYLKYIMISAIIFSIGFTYYHISRLIMSYHPLCCMQSLAFGALIKYMTIFHAGKLTVIRKNFTLFLSISILLWFVSLLFYDSGVKYAFPLLRIFASLSTGMVLTNIVLKIKATRLDKLLNSETFQFIGRISYGIYVYHILVMVLLNPIIQKLSFYVIGEHNLLRYNLYVITMPLYTAITIFLAWLSFKYIESPINRLKNRKNPNPKMAVSAPAS